MKYTFVYKSSNCNLSESAESSKSKLLARLIPAFSSEYQYLVFHADSKGKLLQSDIIDLAVENLNSDGYSLNSIKSAKTRIMNILDKLGAELLPDSTGFLLLRYNNDELFNSFEDALWIQTMFSNDRSEEVIQPKLKSDPTFTLPVYQCKSDKSEVGLWTVKLKGAESPATLANDPKVKISRLFSTTQKSKVKTLIYDTRTKNFTKQGDLMVSYIEVTKDKDGNIKSAYEACDPMTDDITSESAALEELKKWYPGTNGKSYMLPIAYRNYELNTSKVQDHLKKISEKVKELKAQIK